VEGFVVVVNRGNKLGVAGFEAAVPKENGEEGIPPSGFEAGGWVVEDAEAPPKSEAPRRGAGRWEFVSVDSGRVDERFKGDEPNRLPPEGAAEEFPKRDILPRVESKRPLLGERERERREGRTGMRLGGEGNVEKLRCQHKWPRLVVQAFTIRDPRQKRVQWWQSASSV
jgi:hypothetical protein